MSAGDISFKVSNEISSWQQTVEFYFDENCWQNLQKYGFSFCGKLNVYGVYSCSGNSDTNSPLNASSTSVAPHPPLIRPKAPVIFGLLLILQLYPLAVFLIHFCPSVTLHCNCPTSDSHHLLCELFHFPPIFPVFFPYPPLNPSLITAGRTSLSLKCKHITPFAQKPLVTVLHLLYAQAQAP